MTRNFFHAIIGVSLLFSIGCASSYTKIHPDKLIYSEPVASTENIIFSYKYNVLQDTRNIKYAKKEDEKGIKLVACKITNNTGHPIIFNKNAVIVANDSLIPVLDCNMVNRKLKQHPVGHLLWLGLLPIRVRTGGVERVSHGNGYYTEEPATAPMGYLLGPLLSLPSFLIGTTANSAFYSELVKFNLISRKIENNESVYGLFGIADSTEVPLSLKLKKP